MDKKSYLVIGLESSCTKFVSKLIAVNTGIIKNFDHWSGFHSISDGVTLVSHRSLPHGDRENFISIQEADLYDHIVITTRDFNCSLLSKNKDHQPDINSAYSEHAEGAMILKLIMSELGHKVELFSYESAMILQFAYLHRFLIDLNIEPLVFPEVNDVNLKYIQNDKLGEIVEYYC